MDPSVQNDSLDPNLPSQRDNQGIKRPYSEISPPISEESHSVAEHYNSRGNQSFKRRRESPIFELRKLNNWIKSVLILQYTSSGDYAFDIGGGKGGDLTKWEKARISHLVLADIASKSVEDAVARYNDSFKHGGRQSVKFSSAWIASDCCLPMLQQELSRVDFFDVVSSQFSIHYSFENRERAEGYIANAAFKMRPGAYFFGTTVDAHVLLNLASKSEDKRSFGNSQYKVVFDEPFLKINNGQRYCFTLEDAVENVPEYVVDPDTFIAICQKYDLEFLRMENLQSIYNQEGRSRRFGKMLDEMKIPFPHQRLDQNSWETVGLYLAFVFRKRGAPETTKHNVRFEPHEVQLSEIAHFPPILAVSQQTNLSENQTLDHQTLESVDHEKSLNESETKPETTSVDNKSNFNESETKSNDNKDDNKTSSSVSETKSVDTHLDDKNSTQEPTGHVEQAHVEQVHVEHDKAATSQNN